MDILALEDMIMLFVVVEIDNLQGLWETLQLAKSFLSNYVDLSICILKFL